MTIDVTRPEGTNDDLTCVEESPPVIRLGHRLRRAQWVLLAIVAASVLMSAGGLIGAGWVKSPAQIAAQTRPPSPSLLTAVVTRQVVSETLISRGIVMAAHQVQATPDAEPGAQRLVITSVDAAAGSTVQNGDVLLTVSDQPMFVLRGAVPAWRDLTPGESGSDVAELQAALGELGYSSSPDANGFFGEGTKSAVSAFFSHLGFTAPTTGASSEQLQAAQGAITTAQDKLAADERLASKGGPAGQGAKARLPADQAAVANAQQSYDNLAERSGPMVPINDVIFVPSFPATLAALSGQRGAVVQAPLVTIDAGRPDIMGQFDPSAESLIKPGQAVVVQDQDSGWQADGAVQAVEAVTTGNSSSSGSSSSGGGSGQTGGSGSGQETGSSANGSGGVSYLPVIISLKGGVPITEIGQNVELTVSYAHSAGAVLAVPEAAIRTDAAGHTYVIKVGSYGRQLRVPVTTGITGNGMVTVTAQAGRLSAGQHVVTGS
jgi:peptidoglycan hydrolase-like protein with peptidoglycan-binding domain